MTEETATLPPTTEEQTNAEPQSASTCGTDEEESAIDDQREPDFPAEGEDSDAEDTAVGLICTNLPSEPTAEEILRAMELKSQEVSERVHEAMNELQRKKDAMKAARARLDACQEEALALLDEMAKRKDSQGYLPFGKEDSGNGEDTSELNEVETDAVLKVGDLFECKHIDSQGLSLMEITVLVYEMADEDHQTLVSTALDRLIEAGEVQMLQTSDGAKYCPSNQKMNTEESDTPIDEEIYSEAMKFVDKRRKKGNSFSAVGMAMRIMGSKNKEFIEKARQICKKLVSDGQIEEVPHDEDKPRTEQYYIAVTKN